MSPSRLILAQWMGRLLPPIVSNRLTLHHVYPFDNARQGGEFRKRGVTGSVFHGSLADVHGYMFAMHGYFDWRVIAVAGAVLRGGDVAVEVGANVGTETIALADLVGPQGKVYAVEPLPANLARLERLRAESGLKQVEVLPFALSDAEGPIEFVAPSETAHSGIGHIRGGEDPKAGITVNCKTADGLFLDRGPIRFMTIDVEGAEIGVLRGGEAVLRRDRPVLVLEAHAPYLRRFGHDLNDLSALLKSLGYWCQRITKLGLAEPDLAAEFQTNWVAIPDGPDAKALASRIRRRILSCGLLPCLPGLSPLTRGPVG